MSVIGQNIAYALITKTMKDGEWRNSYSTEKGVIIDKVMSPNEHNVVTTAYLVKRVDDTMTAGHFCYDIVQINMLYDIQERSICLEKYL